MTGYGKSTAVVNGKKIHVEIKSLNSKALDLSTRIVPLYREKEMEIRSMVGKALERGKVDLTIWVEKDDAQAAAPINTAVLNNYCQQIRKISEEQGIPLPADWFATLLRMPDVVGMGLKDALFILENRGLKVSFTGKGSVRSQSIRAGEPLRRGSTVYLKLR